MKEHIRALIEGLHYKYKTAVQEAQDQYDEELEAVEILSEKLNVNFQSLLDELHKQPADTGIDDAGELPMTQRVLKCVTNRFMTVEEISESLGVDKTDVRNALYQQRIRPLLSKREIDGLTAYKVDPNSIDNVPRPTQRTGVTDSIRKYLNEFESGTLARISRYVADDLQSPLDEIKPKVAATLSSLKRRGHVCHDSGSGVYENAQDRSGLTSRQHRVIQLDQSAVE